jgi:hypothetical protein
MPYFTIKEQVHGYRWIAVLGTSEDCLREIANEEQVVYCFHVDENVKEVQLNEDHFFDEVYSSLKINTYIAADTDPTEFIDMRLLACVGAIETDKHLVYTFLEFQDQREELCSDETQHNFMFCNSPTQKPENLHLATYRDAYFKCLQLVKSGWTRKCVVWIDK